MIKHKKWIGKIYRSQADTKSRETYLSLDKNERIEKFEKNFIKKIFSKINPKKFNSYPEVFSLYKGLSKLHKLNYNQFVITAGADGAIKNCFELFVSKGDKVIVLNPTFAMVDIYCKIANAKKVSINYDKKLNLNINHILQNIDKSISLIVIANPNSPTGTLISIKDIEKIIKKARIFNLPVLIDEAYYGFCNKTVLPLIKKYKNLIISRTFSKAYGLAGLRVGYLIADSKVAKLLFNLKPMYEVNSIAILSSLTALQHPEIRRKYILETQKGLEILIKYLKKKNISYIQTEANFIYINLGKRIQYFYDKFIKNKILTKKGMNIKGYENYLRITLAPPKQIKKIISKLKV